MKRTPLKKKSDKPRSKQIAKLDVLFSQYIRGKANNKCEYCGKGKPMQLQCHHGVVHRKYMNTRYEEDNCACVCVSCHWYLGNFPRINSEFFKKRIGSDRMEQLEVLARTRTKIDLDAVEERLRSLKEFERV